MGRVGWVSSSDWVGSHGDAPQDLNPALLAWGGLRGPGQGGGRDRPG